jgi:hypothetical protein
MQVSAKPVLPQLSQRQSEITEMDIYAIVTEKIINLYLAVRPYRAFGSLFTSRSWSLMRPA